jgi:hypothetical protein
MTGSEGSDHDVVCFISGTETSLFYNEWVTAQWMNESESKITEGMSQLKS